MAQPLVIIRRVAEGYHVDVQPPLPDGEDRARTFRDKVSAWSFAQGLWAEHKIGCCDMTEGLAGQPSNHGRRTE